MKRIIALLFIAALMAGQNAQKAKETANESYIYRSAVATSSDVLTLDDGETIRLYNGDRLIIDETYILLLDPVNDNELLNYTDLETYELKHME